MINYDFKPNYCNNLLGLGDATDIRYIEMTSCDFIIVGEEFSRKPYAIGVQKGSPLKAAFDSVYV